MVNQDKQVVVTRYLKHRDNTTLVLIFKMKAERLNLIRLAHIQQQHEQLQQQNKHNRSQNMPRRRAQKTAIQQRNLNPVLDLKMSV